jgi:ribosome-associated toxin RatA of RatAB toxin-antitoxin module
VKSIRRKARVPYSPEQMYDLVNDVRAYPEFLPWCQRATVTFANERRIEAALEIGVRGVTHKFSTRNALERPHRIRLDLLEGPFRKLAGQWRFEPLEGGGCEVVLELDFEAASVPLKVLFEMLFEELVRSQMAAFIARAETVYG